MADQALSPFRVLEAASSVAGAYCGKVLAGCGADVIKIEEVGLGDPARRYGPFPGDVSHPEQSGLFLHLNTNKKSITLNLKTQTGANLFKELVLTSDVVVEDFHPGAMHELGLCYQVLAKTNPGVVMTSITPFGLSGPYRDFKGAEIITFALGGYMDLTGSPDREPLKGYGFLGQYPAGICGAIAIMSALSARDYLGSGQHIDLSTMESVLLMIGGSPLSYLESGEIHKRAGVRLFAISPKGPYPSTTLPCRNGYVQVQWRGSRGGPEGLSQLTSEPKLEDPDFGREPRGHADEIDALMLPWLMAHDKEEIVRLAQASRFPFTQVLDPGELLSDPQHQARGMFTDVEHPVLGRLTQPGAPFKMSETPWETKRAPLLGEHNELVYGDLLGYSSQDLVRLRQQGVI